MAKQFEYKHEQSIDENIRNLGLCYRIRYGLDYQFSSKAPFAVKTISGYSFRSIEEPLVGEQLLRKASIQHINAIYGSHRKLLLDAASKLYKHEDNQEYGYWADFNDCYKMFLKKEEDTEPEEEKNYSADIAQVINTILEDQADWLADCEASVQETADAVLCYFLTRRSNDETVWDLHLLTSQTEGDKKTLRDFMNEEIGIQTANVEESPESVPDIKGVDAESSPEDTVAPKS